MKHPLSCIFLLTFFLFGCSVIKKNNNMAGHVPLKDLIKEDGYSDVVYFDIESYGLKIESEDSLMRVAQLQAISKTYAYLSGHADKSGNKKSNFELSRDRVETVKQYLKDLGVSEEYIKTEYYGDEHPSDIGDNSEAYAKNRRVEIVLKNTEAVQNNK